MKKITFLTVLFIAITAKIISQPCLPEGITFSNQSMIDDFQNNYPDCDIIEGNVRIDGNDISNVDGLSSISAINGDLEIRDNPVLSNLSGLSNLTFVGGSLSIQENAQLPDFTGLNNLVSVGAEFSIYLNMQLTNLAGLDSLSSVGTYFSVDVNENLVNLEGVNNLSSIGIAITLTENYALESLNGLENVTSDLTYIILQNNPNLNDIKALQNIGSISYLLAIMDHNSLDNLSGFENISLDSMQRLKIIGNPQLSECAIQSICKFLVDTTSIVEITENATGCNNQEEVIVKCHDGIHESVNYNVPTIYPNPAKDFLGIDTHGSNIDEAIIFNEFGQKLYIHYNGSNSIDISNLLSGIYIIELKLDAQRFRKVFIVAK